MGQFLSTLVILLIAFVLVVWLWGLFRGAMYMQQSEQSSIGDKEQAVGCSVVLLIAIVVIIIITLTLIF